MSNISAMTIHILTNWDMAQPWGRFLTVDCNGKIVLHEKEPTEEGGSWLSDGQFELIGSIEPVCMERPIHEDESSECLT
jgi:hypothetical protein